jgi:TolB-like protein
MKTELIKVEEKKAIPRQPFKRILGANNIIITILFVVVCILLYPKIFKKDKFEDINDADEKSIAVLPLRNLNPDEQLEYFSDGVTQEIIDELAKVHQFQLSAFSSTAIYKGTDKSLEDIAAELGVSLILSGSSRIYSDSVRLSIELVNPKSNKRIWNKRYDDVLSSAIKIHTP